MELVRGERGAGQRQDCRLDGADIGCGAWTGYGDAFLNGMAGAEGDETGWRRLICAGLIFTGECGDGESWRGSRVYQAQATVWRKFRAGSRRSACRRQRTSVKKVAVKQRRSGHLVSDGVVQNWPCGDGEYLLEQKIASLNVSSPVDLANLILRYAIPPVRRQNSR